jgi:hypothetical protein
MFTFPALHPGVFAPLRDVKRWNQRNFRKGGNWGVFIAACQLTARGRIESQKRGALLARYWLRGHESLPVD